MGEQYIMDINDKLHEECGVFGIVERGNGKDPAFDVYAALFALQHRGQHSAGIAVTDGAEMRYKKGDGLVGEVFDQDVLETLTGDMAIGHVRYASQLGTSGVNAQPIIVRHKDHNLALAFNGCLTNAARLRTEIESRGGIFQTTGDAEIILYTIVRELLRTRNMEEALLRVMGELEGAYSIVLLTEDKLAALRDPRGFRPLCMGTLGESVVVASESCALDAIGAVFWRDIRPGEVVVIDREHTHAFDSGLKPPSQALCVFEYIYFARPDSVIDGLSVELARQAAGRYLAGMEGEDALHGPDSVVIGAPDSGLSAALGYAQASGLPYATGLVKNRYVGRTFIQSSQEHRERSVRLKLNAMHTVVAGKRVIIVDDSIVRGTTIGRIVKTLREAGAREVHLRISSPPFLHPCYFGTDIPRRSALIANRLTREEMRETFGLDSLRYLSLEDLRAVAGGASCGPCEACFTGEYPVPIVKEEKE
ncbi:MAG: amidophosphoribosyltransferase [Oscillospiraceae bacterium]|nr:amidophosphoribosyltransferase [Oscillospiraceae bacterium]